MKPFLYILLLLSANLVSAQTFLLKMEDDCTVSMTVNGTPVSKEGLHTIPVTESENFNLYISNPSKKALILNIKSASGNDQVKLTDHVFSENSGLAAGKSYILKTESGQIDLTKPFYIYFGCSIAGKPVMSPLFHLTRASTAAATPITNQAVAKEGIATSSETEPVYIPGSPIYDAIKLSNEKNVSDNEFKAIMQVYFPDDTITDINQPRKLLEKNPFLSGIINNNWKPLKEEGSKSYSGGQILPSLSFSSIGGMDITNIADGLAKFLVKRTKQELSVNFFRRFKQMLDSTRDLSILFPETVQLLQAIDKDIYDYEKYLAHLQEAFKKDISSIHHNLPGIIDNHPTFFARYPNLEASLRSGCYIATELENQSHPADILDGYPIEYLHQQHTLKAGVQSIQLLSLSLRDTATEANAGYWVNISKVRELVNNKRNFKIYLGLIYELTKTRFNGIDYGYTSFLKILDTVAARYDSHYTLYDTCRRFILGFGVKTDALNRMIKENNKPAGDSAAFELYAKYFRSVIDLVEYASKATTLPLVKNHVTNLDSTLHNYLQIAYAAADIVVNTARKNYTAVINNTIKIYEAVQAAPAQQLSADSLKKFRSTLANLARYGSFMSAVATAKNSDEVAQSIEAAALPVGSARVKRHSKFNVAINAYTGLFAGHEWIQGVSNKTAFNTFGLTAPIGVAASWGSSKGWSKSIFLSLVDIGAMAAFRFADNSTAEVPTIQLKHIVSPGAFFSLGFPKTPLSLNLGGQMGPNLRKVDHLDGGLPSADISNKIYWRLSASICVDIPLFNLYTTQR